MKCNNVLHKCIPLSWLYHEPHFYMLLLLFPGTWLILKWFHCSSVKCLGFCSHATVLHFDLYILAASLLACQLITGWHICSYYSDISHQYMTVIVPLKLSLHNKRVSSHFMLKLIRKFTTSSSSSQALSDWYSNLTFNDYWTVHHCISWRMKDQLDVTCYFISLVMCSTCFGH